MLPQPCSSSRSLRLVFTVMQCIFIIYYFLLGASASNVPHIIGIPLKAIDSIPLCAAAVADCS